MITWDEWEDKYLPTTPLSQDDVPADVPFDHIWTMIDGDGRYANIINGYRIINRLGYFVTEVPWTEDVFVSNQKEF
jgi:hypothetical protein